LGQHNSSPSRQIVGPSMTDAGATPPGPRLYDLNNRPRRIYRHVPHSRNRPLSRKRKILSQAHLPRRGRAGSIDSVAGEGWGAHQIRDLADHLFPTPDPVLIDGHEDRTQMGTDDHVDSPGAV